MPATRNKFIKAIINTIRFVWQLLVIGAQWMLLLVILYRVVPIVITPLHVKRLVQQVADGKSMKLHKSWTSIEYMGDNIVKAVLAAEDGMFYNHYGFDFEQMQKAIESNWNKGKRLRGASTISQQTAKNLFFTPTRSWLRKLPEVPITALLELLWTKNRILEVYLNIIETGDGIYGIQAATRYYFKTDAENLSKRQAALLASCLPNPLKRRPDNPTSHMIRKTEIVMRGMNHVKLPNE
jgi:monofunctional biosynthetic peptidoglycan transglycosylase